MGWCFHSYLTSPQTRDAVKREITRLTTWETEDYSVRPLQMSSVGNTWYIAARYTPKYDGAPLPDVRRGPHIERDADGGYTIALVFLTKRDRGEWGYKAMDEFCGPVEASAPVSILNALSPLVEGVEANEYARAWRARCREYHAARRKAAQFKTGDRVQLAAPVRFTDGHESDLFLLSTYEWKGKHRRRFMCLRTGNFYRFGAARLRDATLIEGPTPL